MDIVRIKYLHHFEISFIPAPWAPDESLLTVPINNQFHFLLRNSRCV